MRQYVEYEVPLDFADSLLPVAAECADTNEPAGAG
jgi:hypothetical protein